ncbi:LLM class flavin-dependent oxidoreductase [Pseudonocardia sp. CA-107938]|uniref:LLM class flavin-dependent oxidoreductase n=1 Tax=Pseudonocardia sp. CA-107938 TaxID=3240021 RepID=UPI003D8A8149
MADPSLLVEWARRADRGPISTIALLDRLVYDNPEPLVALSMLAGATERVRLQTEVLIAPLHRTAVLAKQAATLHVLSGGRFTLGLGIGGREDDYDAVGLDVRRRGRRLDEQLQRLHQTWSGSTGIGPVARPPVLFGGFADAVLDRVGRFGDGFLGAALPPPAMARLFDGARVAWERHGRTGSPRLVVQVNAALGGTADVARAELRRYYGDNPYLDHMLDSVVTTPDAARATIATYRDLGVDEVMFYCWAPDPEQVDRLAEVGAP